MNYIKINNVTFAYERGETPAVRHLSLAISQGEFVVLAGSNGSGKSTLLRLMNGLLKPHWGTVIIDNLDTSHEKNSLSIHRKAGMVFQEPENQLTATIVEEDVAFGPENLVFSDLEMKKAVTQALELTGLKGLEQRSTTSLSAGQQQRLALAGILAMSPQCLLLDEPTSMLNPTARHEFMNLIHRLNKEKGLTIIMVTHNIEEILAIPRMVVLNKGQIVCDGLPDEILAENRVEQWGLVPPEALNASKKLALMQADFPLTVHERELARQLGRDKYKALKKTFFEYYPLSQRQLPDLEEKTPLITIKNMAHDYLKGTVMKNRALQDINLTLYPGETAVLIGTTGSGKSTLLQHMNGLLLADEGEVTLLDGESLNSKTSQNTVQVLRQNVGLVMQRPEKQLFERYVGDDVAFAPRQLGLKEKNLTRRVKWAMDLAGLPFSQFKDRPIYALSGGEKRKAALAGVIAMKPKVLLLDEPSAGLDPLSRKELHQILINLQKQGTALVIATHDMDEAAALADRIYLMEGGSIVQEGPVDRIFSLGEELKRRGLEPPFVKRIEGDL